MQRAIEIPSAQATEEQPPGKANSRNQAVYSPPWGAFLLLFCLPDWVIQAGANKKVKSIVQD
jgi:hypothetical protein